MPIFHPEGFCAGLSGRNGNLTYEKTKNGTVFFNFKAPTDPHSAPQQTVRSDFRKATQAFSTLTKTQVDAWNAYAATQTTTTKGGLKRKRSGVNVFAALATKYLLVTPNGTIPTTPPATPFLGDAPVVTATAGTGKITFTANVGNTTGVTTELLFQKLANGNRKPAAKYKTGAYFTFALGSLSKDVTVPPGYYAAGYRFVKVATGQTSPIQPLPVTQVTFSVAKKAA